MKAPPSRGPVGTLWAALGSLKLTVALLGAAILLVFFGTMAQVDQGIWPVLRQYFRCWIAWVDLKIFNWFLPAGWGLDGGFPLPGGWLIGGALVVNLLVAHAQRISLKASGGRLAGGLLVTAAGAGLTWFAISRVFDADSSGEVISPSWRVTRQLLEGAGAALVLYWGCRMLFARKAGIVLLHAGIIMMMVSELWTGLFAVEARMSIDEGQTVNHAEDIRHVELAIVDRSDPAVDDVAVVPEALLRRGVTVRDPELPFDVEVVRYLVNSELRQRARHDPSPATAGDGLQAVAEERPPESGAGGAGKIDAASAYVSFKDKATGESLGCYLTSVLLSRTQSVTAGGKPYEIALRFKRILKPYAVHLKDFQFNRYPGSNTPKDYSSYIRLIDAERGVDRDVRIWMNNPLRYRGDTLYQADFDQRTERTTILQVVENRGWMVPYVGCMIVATGLLGQFLATLIGFLRKRAVA
jgi:hypothetical protein